jgi:hypothetical protein
MFTSRVSLVAEAAHQLGSRNQNDRSAWGGYAYMNYRPETCAKCILIPLAFEVGAIYLSGDDPQTDKWEDWDPMFARWPKWSESFIYTQIQEDQVAYWTNLSSVYTTADFDLAETVSLRIDYHRLWAGHADSNPLFPGGAGTTRGDLFIGKLTYRFSDRWSGHILWEGFIPGDYYFDTADSYNWLRTELMFIF